MKKNIIIIILSSLLILLSVYMLVSKKVEHEEILIEDAPSSIQDTIREDDNKLRFSIFHDETNTYIYYKSDHFPNEYITTYLDLEIKGGKYIVTASVRNATNDGFVSYEKLIKVGKLVDKDIVLVEDVDKTKIY
ncbi:hypothetical protein [Caldalkalibacillus salinus]|uniref:hypothetical protein n=1 Tax=Caldalkalibacillus salinus TaxID=2803787 RepID=UPI0019231C84|nr:hypothetical protein [Caldalkalibacillus salinus]